MNPLRILLLTTTLNAFSATAAEPHDYQILALNAPYSEIREAMKAAKPVSSKDLPDATVLQSHASQTRLLDVLTPTELAALMKALPHASHAVNDTPINVTVESTNATARDLKISGLPVAGKPMDTFVSVYPTQSVVMVAPEIKESKKFIVYILSPK